MSQEAVLAANKGEPIEGIVGAGAGIELRCPTHRVRNHFSGELWINMLSVSWAFLKNSMTMSLMMHCHRKKETVYKYVYCCNSSCRFILYPAHTSILKYCTVDILDSFQVFKVTKN